MKRYKSIYIKMRKKHNYIKEKLILNAVNKVRYKKDTVEVFDISVGRFGDLHKYIKGEVDYVLGIDPNEDHIDEAENRLLHSNLNCDLRIEKITDDTIETNDVFDIVVCNFTLHYFFEKESMLHNVFKHVTRCLRKGGYFIGTSIDGSKIENKDTDYYKIEKKYEKKESPFGNPYTFYLKDGEDTGLYDFLEIEYIVDREIFIKMARDYGLKLLKIEEFESVPYKLEPWEEEISKMYFSFVFCLE